MIKEAISLSVLFWSTVNANCSPNFKCIYEVALVLVHLKGGFNQGFGARAIHSINNQHILFPIKLIWYIILFTIFSQHITILNIFILIFLEMKIQNKTLTTALNPLLNRPRIEDVGKKRIPSALASIIDTY